MSRWLDRARRRSEGDGGFTLIEIMVALTLVAIAAAGSIPLLIVGTRAAQTSRLNTQAKNLAQARFESMRDLPFHVDRQNGPFVDLLDIYYTDASGGTHSLTRAGETENGQYGTSFPSPAPTGPVYKVTVQSLPGNTAFSQTIYTQFLSATGSYVPASSFSGYDSQTQGSDQPPSTMVGVTVVTTWTDHGTSHSYTSYTRISDSRGLSAALTSQASATFLRASSSGPASNALTVDLAKAEASGGQSTGSVAAADVRALDATDAGGTDYLGANAVATSPSGAGSSSGQLGGFVGGTGACGWVSVGKTDISDVSASTTGGLPKVPSDVDSATPPANQAAASVSNNGNSCGGVFGFSNQSTSYDPNLMLDGTSPLVTISDTGTNTVVTGSAWVNASDSSVTPHTVTSGANASSTKSIVLFPGATFTGGLGVLKVKLSQSSIACSSSVTGGVTTQSATGSWTVAISYFQWNTSTNSGSMVSLPTYTWNSATNSGSADPLASIDPSSIVVYQSGATVLHLSDYIASWSTQRKIVEDPSSGVHQLTGIVSLATQPVRSGDIISAVGLQVGNLSCVADDRR